MTSATSFRLASSKSSPALRSFESNPFRILRLEVDTTTADAVTRAEQALTLEKVGLSLEEPVLMPWLPEAGSYELQQAAQTMEEPLSRLKRQMMWFDGVRDPHVELLHAALREPLGEQMQQCLAETVRLPDVSRSSNKSDAGITPTERVEAFPAAPSPVCPHCGKTAKPTDVVCRSCNTPIRRIDIGPPAAAVTPLGKDIRVVAELPFMASLGPSHKVLDVQYGNPCTACGGAGSGAGEETCPSCFGDTKRKALCFRCGGKGTIAPPCSVCRANGTTEEVRQVELDIPASVDNGTTLRLPGRGQPSRKGGSPGDLLVEIKITEHPYFTRLGDNILNQLPVSVMEAARGDSVSVLTVDGPADVRLEPETHGGELYCIRGRGIAHIGAPGRGDHYFKISVVPNEGTLQGQRRVLAGYSASIQAELPSLGAAYQKQGSAQALAEEIREAGDLVAIAHFLNQANLRLLVAAVSTDGAMGGAMMLRPEARSVPRERWKSLGGTHLLPDAHRVLFGAPAARKDTSSAREQWAGALRAWMALLAHPWFDDYVAACIQNIEDDFVSSDDVETVRESVQAALLDLAAEHTRFLLLEGRYELTIAMLGALADSGIDLRLLTPTLRPLRSVFQAEISELEGVLEQPGYTVIGAVDNYFRRLDGIRTRWEEMDAAGIVGLSDMIDQAVEKGYLQLRRLEKPDISTDGLLKRATAMTRAQSLRERIASFQAELIESRKRICYYCQTELPDFERSVVLKGKKVTNVSYRGNTRVTTYALRNAWVLRCGRCAKLHDFIQSSGMWFGLAISPVVIVGVIAITAAIISAFDNS